MSGFAATEVTIKTAEKSLMIGLSFSVAVGEVLTIMGSSGSGKSSLLSYVVGSLSSEIQASGKLYLNDRRIDHLQISDRKVGILFQDDLLFPHLSVGENILFAMREPKDKKTRIQIINEHLKEAGLEDFFNRKPSTLSGGQRARVGALRTLLSKPQLILLDEPFSKLDKSLRSNFRNYVFSEIKKQNIPCILVTHDEVDAPSSSHKIVLEAI